MRRSLVFVRLLAVLAYMFVMTAMQSPAAHDPGTPPAIVAPADPT